MRGRRSRYSLWWSLGLVWIIPTLLGAGRPPGLGEVSDVRTWSYADYTRVVVELSREPELTAPELVRLAPNKSANRPERLYLDVPEVWVGLDFEEGVEVGDGLLEGVRLGQNTLRNTRLVIDLARYDHHRVFTLPSPPRIVVDVYADRANTNANRNGGDDAPPNRRRNDQTLEDSTGRLPTELRRVQTVVVDPGHGGSDPGAMGVGGLKEKDVNLKIAKRLAAELKARGFDVVLTREDDRHLDLEDRTALAESAQGDVFISIHANASRRKAARGIEVYTLDANHERHSLNVASRENGVPAARLDPLQRALATLRAGELAGHSERLGRLVHDRVMDGARAKELAVPALGLKTGPFYVLFMSNMSSVLVETGFVTNRQDAALLRSKKYQTLVAKQIADGVDRYRQEIEWGLDSSTAYLRPSQ